MVDVVEGYAYITSGTVAGNTITGGTTVKIRISKIDDNIDKELKLIKTTQGGTKMLDLNKPENVYTIYGSLKHDSGDTVFNKRDNLKALAVLVTSGNVMGTPVTFVYNNNSVQVCHTNAYFKKLMITEDGKISQILEKINLPVTIALILGDEL